MKRVKKVGIDLYWGRVWLSSSRYRTLLWNWAKTYLPKTPVSLEPPRLGLAKKMRYSRFKGEAYDGLDSGRGKEEPWPFRGDKVHLAATKAVWVGRSDPLAVIVAVVVLILIMMRLVMGMHLVLVLLVLRVACFSSKERPSRVLTVRQGAIMRLPSTEGV